MEENNLRLEAIAKVKQCKAIAQDKFGIELKPIRVLFNLNDHVAGLARSYYQHDTKEITRQEIHLHPYFMRKFPKDYINQVIPHEMAHLIVDISNGLHQGHNYIWQNVMTDYFQLVPEQYHYYGDTKSKLDEVYSCICQRCNRVNMVSEQVARSVATNGMWAERCKFCKIKFSVNQTFSLTIE